LLARGLGGADAKGVATLHIRAPGAVWSSFDGYMGDVQFGSVARWQKDALDLKLDLPRAEPAAARALIAKWPLLQNAEASLHLKGKPPDLDVDLQAKVGDSATLNATGNLNLATPIRLRLDVEGRKLDLRALWANAPATHIDVNTDLGLYAESGQVVIDVGGALQPTTIGAFAVPAVDFSGNAAKGGFSGEAKIHDGGLPVDLGFSVYPDGKLELNAEAKRVNLAKVERLKPYFDGSGSADVKVHASLDHGRLDTTLSADVRSLEYQGVALKTGHLTAGAKGSVDKLDQLALDARLSGKKLSAGRFAFEDVNATAKGPLRVPTVTTTLKDSNGPSLDARATVAIAEQVSVRELSLGISRDNVEIRGDVAQVDLAKDRVLIRDLKLHGATGELDGNADITPQSLSVTAKGQNLDLSAFSRVLGLPRGQLEGRASIALEALKSGKTARGSLELSVSKAALANLSGISGQLSAKLDGRKLSGTSTGTVEALGGFSADWDALLDGPITERASFERATGNGTLALNSVTLDYLGQLFPAQDLDIGGQASVTLKLSRSGPNAVPDLQLSGQTQGLSVRIDRKPKPLLLSGIEFMASATLDGASGNTSVALTALQGTDRLITSSVDIPLDLKAALDQKQPLLEQLQTHPLLAKVVVSRVELDNLPAPLRVAGLRGAVRLEGTLRGNLNAPVAALSVRATDLRFTSGDRGEPVDVCGTAEYARETGAFNVGAEVFLPGGFDVARTPCGGKRIANVRLTGQAPFDPHRGIPAWSGTALATLEALPLATIPQLAEARLTGTASGTLLLDRSGQQPNASGQLSLSDLKMDRLNIGDGSLKLRSDEKQAHVDFELKREQTAVKGGLNAGVSWTSQLPALDDAQPIDLSLRATKLEASVLEPLLTDFVSELHGNVDGDVSARLAALGKDEESRRVEQVAGEVKLKGGSFILTGLGFRLRDVDFTATAHRDGKTTIVDIPDIAANAGAKLQNLKANISFRLAGFDIVSGSGSVNVNSLPLVVDGITRANADAKIDKLEIKRYPEKMFVDVHFEELKARLPDESSRELTDLNENEAVQVLQPITQPKGSRDEAALPWQFAIHLGSKAKVERGALLDVPISGDPNVVLASGVGVTGSIMLDRRGTVQISRRNFQIE
ncbi:MAG TPA: hypothetical protein VNG33_07555, partial [Polyangiaceae bacterium]|nr:hypothetical protein [Polyangiaceae bacterium]